MASEYHPFGLAPARLFSSMPEPSTPRPAAVESNGRIMIIAGWLLTSVSGLFLALRLYCKFLKKRGLWWDDHVLIAAWASFYLHDVYIIPLLSDTVINIINIQTFGFGKHVSDLSPETNLATVSLLSSVSGSLAILAAVWSKTSFGMTLLRITGKKTKVAVWCIIVTMNLAMSVNVVTTWIQCWPVQRGWDREVPGSCWDPRVNAYYAIFAAAYSGLMDIVLALLPWSVVWGLQMRRKEKIGVAVAMSMGVFAGGAAFVKCSTIPVILNGDFTFEGYNLVIWGSGEVAITIVAASIPVLRVLVREVRVATRRRYGYSPTGGVESGSHMKMKKDQTASAGTVQRSNSTIVTVTSGYKPGKRMSGSFSTLDDLESGSMSEETMKRLSDANPRKILQTQEITVSYHERPEDEDDLRKMFDHRAAKEPPDDGHVVRLPMRRRPPTIANRMSVHTPTTNDREAARSKTSAPTTTPVALNTTAFFKDAAYGIQMWIGEPPQMVTLDFDTGSSETWVDPPCSGWGSQGYPDYETLCRLLGTYIPEQSQTIINKTETCPGHWIMYGSGTVFIKYYQDTVTFTDPYYPFWETPPPYFGFSEPVQFGVATYATNMPSGILGAGYGAGYNQDYNTFIDELYEQELIKDKDFSICLGSVDADDGEVIFGGVDLGKFEGPLHELELASQLSKEKDGYYRYWINVTSIGHTMPGTCLSVPVTNRSFEERFLPDSGTTLTYIPTPAFNGLVSFFNLTDPTESIYGYTVDCSLRNQPGSVDFTFGDFTVHVPYKDFIFVIESPTPEVGEICVIGALPSDEFFILGDTFLRSVYAVFRQQHHKIYLAKFSNCGSNVVSSHGKDLTKYHGDCGKETHHHKKPHHDRHYGPPPSESSSSSVGIPLMSSSSVSLSTCTKWSTGTFTPPATNTPEVQTFHLKPNSKFGPRPAVETGQPQIALSLTAAVDTATSSDFRLRPSTLPWISNTSSIVVGSTGTPLSPGYNTSTCFSSGSETAEATSAVLYTTVISTLVTTLDGFTTSDVTISGTTFTETMTDTIPVSTMSMAPISGFSSVSSDCSSETSSSSPSSWDPWWSETTTSSGTSVWDPWTMTPSVVTIPVETAETIIVKLESTTYTIVDGSTLDPEPGHSATSSDYSSDTSSESSSWLWSTSETSLSYSSWDAWSTTESAESWSWSSTTSDSTSWDWSSSSTTSHTTKTKTHTYTKTKTSTTEESTTESEESTSTTKHHHHTTTISSSSGTDDLGGYLTEWSWTASEEPTPTSNDFPWDTSSDSFSWGEPTSVTGGLPSATSTEEPETDWDTTTATDTTIESSGSNSDTWESWTSEEPDWDTSSTDFVGWSSSWPADASSLPGPEITVMATVTQHGQRPTPREAHIAKDTVVAPRQDRSDIVEVVSVAPRQERTDHTEVVPVAPRQDRADHDECGCRCQMRRLRRAGNHIHGGGDVGLECSDEAEKSKACVITPCLRAMQDSQNVVGSVKFCEKLVGSGRAGDHGVDEMIVPRFLAAGCLSPGREMMSGDGDAKEAKADTDGQRGGGGGGPIRSFAKVNEIQNACKCLLEQQAV
ncbi:hypothetical protein B0H66DRAFT_643870 [Apodospora peruviana]|uniref:Peptidase A1 domain-containing protein n=1 Tax=Apodospora peruviana TaxID=516989 RepID=A0AAE0HU88_9PEZI|nr:hypothetical protein B0H66DRAFT_643870 [Apodospora peruviana]